MADKVWEMNIKEFEWKFKEALKDSHHYYPPIYILFKGIPIWFSFDNYEYDKKTKLVTLYSGGWKYEPVNIEKLVRKISDMKWGDEYWAWRRHWYG